MFTIDHIFSNSSTGVLRDPISRMLFNHYVHELARNCAAVPDQENPFLTKVLHMAVSNDSVMQGILYFSGTQYPNKSSSTHKTTLTHYAQAVRGLKYGLTAIDSGGNETDDVVALLLTAYFLLSTEVRALSHGREKDSG
jgi:hypothetical protein